MDVLGIGPAVLVFLLVLAVIVVGIIYILAWVVRILLARSRR